MLEYGWCGQVCIFHLNNVGRCGERFILPVILNAAELLAYDTQKHQGFCHSKHVTAEYFLHF